MTERPKPVAWQWRWRMKGGAWDAWERGRFGSDAPPFMDVEERGLYSASTVEALTAERDALLSRVESLEKALKPFALVAEMEERATPCASVMVNVARCRDARTTLKETTDGK